MRDRASSLSQAVHGSFDLIVIGGGINGAGIARDASERGLTVLLLDQHDWGFGTTWRSTKLIHGGLRYLQHGEISLVFESLRERAVLLRTAPHLVRPMPFLLPSYAGDAHRLLTVDAGLTLYDVLAMGGGLARHRRLSAHHAARIEPGLRRVGLRGALGYWDAQVSLPERLCLENVQRAVDAGAVALPYVKVTRLCQRDGTVTGVQAQDERSHRSLTLRGHCMINAAGPWVDDVLRTGPTLPAKLEGTRGAHLVVRFPQYAPRRALYSEAAGDGRPFFIVPWRGVHLVGTTDRRVASPDDALPADEEIGYLLAAAQHLLPHTRLLPPHVWYAYGGIRPLPRTPGAREGSITRRHHIITHADDGYRGLFSVVGGKLSTYRSLAEEVTTVAAGSLGRILPPSRTARDPLVPGSWRPDPLDPRARALWSLYGPRAIEVLSEEAAHPSTRQPLCPHTSESEAQVNYAIRHEGIVTLADLLLRRLPTGWARCLGLDAAPRAADLCARVLGWSTAECAQQVAAYRAEVGRTFRRVPEHLAQSTV